MGDLLEMVLLLRKFLITSPEPVTRTCHLWQKRAPLELERFVFGALDDFVLELGGQVYKIVAVSCHPDDQAPV
jgi:hypothetical protein